MNSKRRMPTVTKIYMKRACNNKTEVQSVALKAELRNGVSQPSEHGQSDAGKTENREGGIEERWSRGGRGVAV